MNTHSITQLKHLPSKNESSAECGKKSVSDRLTGMMENYFVNLVVYHNPYGLRIIFYHNDITPPSVELFPPKEKNKGKCAGGRSILSIDPLSVGDMCRRSSHLIALAHYLTICTTSPGTKSNIHSEVPPVYLLSGSLHRLRGAVGVSVSNIPAYLSV